MSQLMLDDKNTINDINPFVDPENFFPPGSSKHVVDFQKYKPEEQDPEEEYKSPACDVLSKGVGRPGYREEECSLSRPLIPGRNIDRGFTVREKMEIGDGEQLLKEKQEEERREFKKSLNVIIIAILILLIAIL